MHPFPQYTVFNAHHFVLCVWCVRVCDVVCVCVVCVCVSVCGVCVSEKLEELFTTCYPTLSRSPQREETQLVLESVFFPAILPPLLAAYRCHNYIEEVSTARNMCRHVNATPKDLDVRRRFWLLEQVCVFVCL